MPATSRTILRRAGAVLLGLVAALALAEIGLRATGWIPSAMRSKRTLFDKSTGIDRTPSRRVWYDCYPSNPNGEFRALPDVARGSWLLVDNLLPPGELPLDRLSETPWCVEYALSPRGLRDVDHSLDPAAGVVRIAVVGDSFVFGEGVPAEKSLPAALQSRLGRSREILNLGWPGDDTKGELERLQAAAAAFHLRRAVVVFIANDVEMAPELVKEQEYINDLIQVRDQYLSRHESAQPSIGWSRLLALVHGTLDMRRVTERTIGWYRDLYDPRRNAVGLQRLRANLERLAKVPDCRVALVLYPLLEGFEGPYPLHGVHESVATAAKAAGLPVLDLAPAFAGQSTKELWVHPCDHHPNGRAQAIAAKTIAEWLERDVSGFLNP
jgi:lysophospholipase L1-like esterase